jgi:hypothetical protein
MDRLREIYSPKGEQGKVNFINSNIVLIFLIKIIEKTNSSLNFISYEIGYRCRDEISFSILCVIIWIIFLVIFE